MLLHTQTDRKRGEAHKALLFEAQSASGFFVLNMQAASTLTLDIEEYLSLIILRCI